MTAHRAKDEFFSSCEASLKTVESMFNAARAGVIQRIESSGVDPRRAIQQEQRATHTLAWFKVYLLALTEVLTNAREVSRRSGFDTTIEDFTRIAVGELLNQIFSGISMSQSEIARTAEILEQSNSYRTEAIEELIFSGNTPARRVRLAHAVSQPGFVGFGERTLDQTTAAMRNQIRTDRKSTRLNSSHIPLSRMPSSA